MKFFRFFLAALVAAVPFASQAQHSHKPNAAPHGHMAAGETHSHKAPHGGTVRTAGAFHIELVQQPGEVHVYLLDGKEAPVATEGTTGSVTMLTTTNKTSTAALTANDGHFVAALPAGATVRTAIVSLKSNGKSLGARFNKLDVAASKATGAVYACPMHPEVTSSKPGECSKCGMALVKKS